MADDDTIAPFTQLHLASIVIEGVSVRKMGQHLLRGERWRSSLSGINSIDTREEYDIGMGFKWAAASGQICKKTIHAALELIAKRSSFIHRKLHQV